MERAPIVAPILWLYERDFPIRRAREFGWLQLDHPDQMVEKICTKCGIVPTVFPVAVIEDCPLCHKCMAERAIKIGDTEYFETATYNFTGQGKQGIDYGGRRSK